MRFGAETAKAVQGFVRLIESQKKVTKEMKNINTESRKARDSGVELTKKIIVGMTGAKGVETAIKAVRDGVRGLIQDMKDASTASLDFTSKLSDALLTTSRDFKLQELKKEILEIAKVSGVTPTGVSTIFQAVSGATPLATKGEILDITKATAEASILTGGQVNQNLLQLGKAMAELSEISDDTIEDLRDTAVAVKGVFGEKGFSRETIKSLKQFAVITGDLDKALGILAAVVGNELSGERGGQFLDLVGRQRTGEDVLKADPRISQVLTKLSIDQQEEFLKRAMAGASPKDLAQEFGKTVEKNMGKPLSRPDFLRQLRKGLETREDPEFRFFAATEKERIDLLIRDREIIEAIGSTFKQELLGLMERGPEAFGEQITEAKKNNLFQQQITEILQDQVALTRDRIAKEVAATEIERIDRGKALVGFDLVGARIERGFQELRLPFGGAAGATVAAALGFVQERFPAPERAAGLFEAQARVQRQVLESPETNPITQALAPLGETIAGQLNQIIGLLSGAGVGVEPSSRIVFNNRVLRQGGIPDGEVNPLLAGPIGGSL
jgi:AraC-like DNA-binding protein